MFSKILIPYLLFLLPTLDLVNGTNSFGIIEEILDHLTQFARMLPNWSSDQSLIKDDKKLSPDYDFVIIGAGSGGCVLANRLTENENWQVLVLEAGKDESFLTDVPLLAPALHITAYNWGYKTERGPQDENGKGGFCLAMEEGRCNWPRGKAVGGTSVINYMMYARGSRHDYDGWEAMGNRGWAFADVLPYFMKSENAVIPDLDAGYHGEGGFLDVMVSPYASKLRGSFLSAAEEMGYSVTDYNGKNLLGFSVAQANLRNGRRVSASKAFLRPIIGRKNLHVAKFSRVTRIVVDPESRVAFGVEFVRNKKRSFVRARKEVLLSAGALNSPQILMLSGIGPKEHLIEVGIPVIEDLPVGLNLQDHVSMSALTFLVNETITIVEARVASNPANSFDYLFKGSGPFTVPGGAEGLAFINTRRRPSEEQEENLLKNQDEEKQKQKKKKKKKKLEEDKEDEEADIEIVMGIGSLTGDTSGSVRSISGLTEDFVNQVFGPYIGMDGFSLVPVLLHPKSRGRVKLKSSNPFHWPILEPNYYDDKDDLETIVRGIRKAIEIAETSPFKRYNATLVPVKFPGCRSLDFNSDDYWICVCREVSTTLGHFVGTCKMGPREDFGVVDARLRVHGIKNLRVVDASVMPTLISGHTNAPTYMIAEKASDMIKEDWIEDLNFHSRRKL